ncbi:MAG: hypothetical protein CL931_12045 [Deltaproteobacteria bacterium]|nr:hypothetical protein [Deltaproteobacteria bacterium]
MQRFVSPSGIEARAASRYRAGVRRNAPLTTALISLLVLTSYVAAAFVDCETPVDAGIREAARIPSARAPSAHGGQGHGHGQALAHDGQALAHAGHAEPTMKTNVARAHAEPDADPHAGHQGHGGHVMPRSPSSGSADSGPAEASSHGPHAHAHAVEAEPPAARPGLALVPTCRCGCAETRAFVGGALARLGATIPAVHVAALPAALVVDGRTPIDLREPAAFVVDDAVPI